MLFFNLCEGWKNFWHHFGLFLSLFSTFHQNFLQLCKKLPSYISETHQLLFPLVNNSQKWCQKLCNIFSSLHLLQGECGIEAFPPRCREKANCSRCAGSAWCGAARGHNAGVTCPQYWRDTRHLWPVSALCDVTCDVTWRCHDVSLSQVEAAKLAAAASSRLLRLFISEHIISLLSILLDTCLLYTSPSQRD